MLSELDVLKPLPHTPHTCGFSPVCVRIWRFSRLGRSNALPHTSHGSMARSDRAEGRALGDALDPGPLEMAASSRSSAPSQRSPPPVLAPDEIEIDESSPDTDLCSSSAPEDGEIGSITRDRSDVERSSGESAKEFGESERETVLISDRTEVVQDMRICSFQSSCVATLNASFINRRSLALI